MVAADAGCGKTTLIADFVRSQGRPYVWYQLDHTDADPIVFLTYIAQGIKNIEPNFGEAIFPYLSDAKDELLRYPERAADLLINEMLDSIEQPFVLVLDDYHHIGRETVVHKLVDRLLHYSSDLLHVIITTRDLPPLAIMRRRTQQAALIVTRDDLLFNDEEVRGLFRQTLNVELGESEITEYRGRTHGWITALQLVRQVAEQEIHSGADLHSLSLSNLLQQSEKDIFDYFAEEVFSREAEETRTFLMNVSLLDTMHLDTCSAVFPEFRCSATLPELAQKNVFLTAAGEGGPAEAYRFHPLFREFLRRQLRSEIGSSLLSSERTRIAEYYIASKRPELALGYLIEASNFNRAAEIVSTTGEEWIASGAFVSLGLMADRIPAEHFERFPRSMLHCAEVARLQGAIEKSQGLLQQALKVLSSATDAEGEAECLHSLASIARRRGRNAEAFELLGRAEKLVPAESATFMKCSNTRGLCLIAEGKWSDAEHHFRAALETAENVGNQAYIRLITHNLALAPGFRGDFGQALRWFKRIFRDGHSGKQLPQEAIGHLNVARLHLYRGEFEETETHLERALDLCQLYNLVFLRGEIFEAYGNFYREKDDLLNAEAFYERAANAYTEAEIDPASKELFEERSILYRLNGDAGKARGLLENVKAARETTGNLIGVNTALLRLYQVDLNEGKTDGLAEKVESLVRFFCGENHYYDEALANMLLAETYFTLGRIKEMRKPLQRALDLSARFDYEYWLRREILRNPQMFRDEDIFEKLPADLREAAAMDRKAAEAGEQRPGTQSTASLHSVQAHTLNDLTVNVLGHVEIFRDPAKPFASDAWTTKRARDIFCFVATSRNRRVAKEVLIEAFWPGEDPAKVEKNFHPTISHIRKALNSKQAFKQNFLVFRDGCYQLNPDLSYQIDSERFETLIAEAEEAKREKDPVRLRENLDAAHVIYRGEYMAGVYEDWAEERRHYYAEQFGRVLNALAKLSFAEKRWVAVLKYCGELLKDDPYREDVHRLLLKTYAGQAKPASVKKHFENLQELLKKDLGITPSAETTKLYKELV